MLKKLVKYGNSNALVIDKAILELLNIAEGSVLKIRTDGTSIILTPQKSIESQQVHETYTNNQATQDAITQEMSKWYELSEESKKEITKLKERFNTLLSELCQNTNYIKELKAVRKQFSDTTSLKYITACNELRAKHSPEFMKVEKKLTSFTDTCTPKDKKIKPLTEKQKSTMQQEYSKLFNKHKKSCAQDNAFLNNPDYINESQLIAEKYKNNKNSKDYMEALEELLNKFSPETKELRDGVMGIAKKYSGAFMDKKS